MYWIDDDDGISFFLVAFLETVLTKRLLHGKAPTSSPILYMIFTSTPLEHTVEGSPKKRFLVPFLPSNFKANVKNDVEARSGDIFVP